MPPKPCLIGLDEPQIAELRSRWSAPILAHETLPRILVQDGELFVDSPSGFGMQPVSQVVFHGIFEDDHDLIAGLALWGG